MALAFVGRNVASAIEIRRDAAGVNASVFKAADQVGGAAGVAVLATVIATVSGDGANIAGYRAAFLTTSALLVIGAVVAQNEIRRW